eukprot:scaffold247441_cov34-Tisochrysis_lutea.AAC.4
MCTSLRPRAHCGNRVRRPREWVRARGCADISINESTHCCRMCMHVQEDANVTARTMCVGLGQHAHLSEAGKSGACAKFESGNL